MNDIFSLKGRTAFVSAANGHLGRAMVRALGHAGARVYINGRNEEKLAAFAEELGKEGISAIPAAFDIGDLPAVRRFFSSLDRLDVLVNNAVSMTPKSSAKLQPEDFEITYRTSVVASFEAVRAAQPALTKAAEEGDASVINIGTMYALVSPDPKLYDDPSHMSPAHYGAAKAGLLQLTRHLASQLGTTGIRVNALCPGPFPHRDTQDNAPEFVARLGSRTMLGRIGQPDEIGGPVVFLASRASQYVTGAVLTADGGWTAW